MTSLDGEGAPFDRHHFDYSPWSFWSEATPEQQRHQRSLQEEFLQGGAGRSLGEDCFVSDLAAVQADRLELGDRTYIAAHAYVSGTVRTGRDCTVNPFAVVRGDITVGDAVRIGSHASIVGFNHGFEDTDVEIFRQTHTCKGIVIGDDVWIGSHVTILDGVTVGDKAILAGGAVVTKDVPRGAIVGGNPARVVRSRFADPMASPERADKGSKPALIERLTRFADRAREQAPAVLARSWDPAIGDGLYTDSPNATPTVRAQCDAIEISTLLLGRAPDQLPVDEQIRRLQLFQDPTTGLVPSLGPDGRSITSPTDLDNGEAAYHIECVGYALDLLGSSFSHPITTVSRMSANDVVQFMHSRAWRTGAWGAGHDVDALGTALLWNLERGERGQFEAYFGWLVTHVDAATGMWGAARAEDGLLQIVNGYYRTTRGSFAQFGIPLPHPERAVDTVLAHSRDARFFADERLTACNVLDVIHPLWMLRPQVGEYRSEEVRALASRLIEQTLSNWIDDQGFGFQVPAPANERVGASVPSLQGTEMWLAILWLLTDVLGASDSLGYRPRGIHRPEPAISLPVSSTLLEQTS